MTNFLPSLSSPLSSLVRFSSVQLVAVDIDGTLATGQRQDVADLIKSAVKTLGHYGVTVTVATGRAVAGAHGTIFGLSERLGPAIVYNGAVVVDLGRGQILLRNAISEIDVATIRDITLKFGGTMWAYDCSDPSLSFQRWDGERLREEVCGWSRLPGPGIELNGLPVKWSDETTSPTEAVAILIARTGGNLSRILLEIGAISGISVTSSTPDYLEIRPPGTTKASALSLVSKLYDLDARQVLTIGDNHNDVEMLEWAGTSVAVANATTAARHSATFVSSQSDASGVLEVLRLVISAKRFARGYALPTEPS